VFLATSPILAINGVSVATCTLLFVSFIINEHDDDDDDDDEVSTFLIFGFRWM